MPRRTIVLGRNPSQFEFNDDAGPLANGLGYVAGQWLASGRDRAQIEMAREEKERAAATHSAERAQDVDFHQQDLNLRKLALGDQIKSREDAAEQHKTEHGDLVKHNADTLRQTQVRDAATAAEHWRDDMGAVGKFAYENTIGKWTAPEKTTPAADLGRDKFNWERAVAEIGDPNHDTEIVQGKDFNGKPYNQELKRPLSPEAKKERVAAITRRYHALQGHPDPDPITPDDPHGSPGRTWAPEHQLATTTPISASQAGVGQPDAPAEPAPVDPAALNEAVTRATKTLTDTTGLTPEQRTKLARTVADARGGNPQAIQALVKWHTRQPDAIQRKAQDAAQADSLADMSRYSGAN